MFNLHFVVEDTLFRYSDYSPCSVSSAFKYYIYLVTSAMCMFVTFWSCAVMVLGISRMFFLHVLTLSVRECSSRTVLLRGRTWF